MAETESTYKTRVMTSNRIEKTFERLRREARCGLIGYLTAGDPNPDACFRNLQTAVASGLDVLELGVPFSDPTADGPVIQEASRRALAAGMTVPGALNLAARVRAVSSIPIILFGYANPFFRYGYERLCADARASGIDGLLVVDLPLEELEELEVHARRHALAVIRLLAPTTSAERAAAILSGAQGFVYFIRLTGVTGTRADLGSEFWEKLKTLRRLTSLPIAVGFGLSSGREATELADVADAVVVGSALVQAAREGHLESLVKELKEGLKHRAGPPTGAPAGLRQTGQTP